MPAATFELEQRGLRLGCEPHETESHLAGQLVSANDVGDADDRIEIVLDERASNVDLRPDWGEIPRTNAGSGAAEIGDEEAVALIRAGVLIDDSMALRARPAFHARRCCPVETGTDHILT